MLPFFNKPATGYFGAFPTLFPTFGLNIEVFYGMSRKKIDV